MSSHLKDTTTKFNTSATTDTGSYAENTVQKKAAAEISEQFVTEKLRELFGGHFVFDSLFASELVALCKEFGLGEKHADEYIRYVFNKASAKKPDSLTNMFYKMAKQPAIVQDYLVELSKTKKAASKTTLCCPICGNEHADRFGCCSDCGFDMTKRHDEEAKAFARRIYALPIQKREAYQSELSAEQARQMQYSLTERLTNQQLRADFKKAIDAINNKYGIA